MWHFGRSDNRYDIAVTQKEIIEGEGCKMFRKTRKTSFKETNKKEKYRKTIPFKKMIYIY